MEAALAADRYPGFEPWDLDREAVSIVGFAGSPGGADVVEEDGVLCGYVSHRHDDLTVHPAHRRRGHGRRLLAAGLRKAAAAGEEVLTLYVPTQGPGHDFAAAMGMAYRSSLWRLKLPAGVAVTAPSFPSGVLTREFGDWLPLERYVALMHAGFEGHPTAVHWTLDAVARVHGQPGFDRRDILLVCPADSPDEPIGFVRTEIRPPAVEGGLPGGEILVLGVISQWRARGLGRELLRWGVAHLRDQGATELKLSVEGRNELALGLYRRNGFEPEVEWPNWTLAVTARVPGTAG
jgi:mycothiol synthase